jgi:hypothetical protein
MDREPDGFRQSSFMKKSVVYMSKSEYLAMRENIIANMADAVLDVHYHHGAPCDELDAIEPSLREAIGAWWDSLNTYRDPKNWWHRLVDWLGMFRMAVLR